MQAHAEATKISENHASSSMSRYMNDVQGDWNHLTGNHKHCVNILLFWVVFVVTLLLLLLLLLLHMLILILLTVLLLRNTQSIVLCNMSFRQHL